MRAALFSNKVLKNESLYELTYKDSNREHKLWLGVSNQVIAEQYNIAVENIKFYHTSAIRYEEAPYGVVIVVPESYTGTPYEMVIIEHEIGHVLSGHQFICEDEETKILREIEADTYVVNKESLKELLKFSIAILNQDYITSPDYQHRIQSANRRLEAIK